MGRRDFFWHVNLSYAALELKAMHPIPFAARSPTTPVALNLISEKSKTIKKRR